MLKVASASGKRAVLYLRRSTDRQEQSIDDQRKACLGFADAKGYAVVGEYVDDARTGTTTDGRDAFERMMDDALKPDPRSTFIIAYDVKRFSRGDNVEAGYWLYRLRENGVRVTYATENFNGDDSDDLVRSVKQWQARQESKDLSKVTFRGLISRASGGWWNGGVPPYGFDREYVDSGGKAYQRVRFNADRSKLVSDVATGRTRLLPRGERLSPRGSSRVLPVARSDTSLLLSALKRTRW